MSSINIKGSSTNQAADGFPCQIIENLDVHFDIHFQPRYAIASITKDYNWLPRIVARHSVAFSFKKIIRHSMLISIGKSFIFYGFLSR